MPSRPPPPNSDITVAILAGGMGTRLRSVVSDRPKVLASVGSRPFLAWWLDALEAQGFRDIVLCTGFRASQVEEAFGSSFGKLSLRYSVEDEPLGTGGALHKALPLIRSSTLLVLNGDSFCRQELRPFIVQHFERGSRASLVVTSVPDVGRYGSVQFNPEGKVQRFQEKTGQAGPGWINAGIYLLSRDLFSVLPSHMSISLERDLLPRWLYQDIRTFTSPGRFIDIGTPESLSAATEFFLTQPQPQPLAAA
jgi:NDP-sugar pyrophosphorylase family protein